MSAKKIAIPLLGLLLAWPASVPPQKKPATAVGPDKQYLQKVLDAWCTMDMHKVAPYYSQAPENVYFDIAPMEYHGWAEWSKGFSNLFSDYKSFKISLKGEPSIHTHGNLAWSTELWHVDAVHKDGKPETIDGRNTTVWQKQGDKWLIVHEHDSVPLAMPQQENK